MRSSISGETTHYQLGKWADGDNPGAAAINNNWDVIDTQIHSASVLAEAAYTASLSQSIYVADPIYKSGSNASITLKYDTGSFKIVSGALALSGSAGTLSGSFTGSFSGSFTGSVLGQSGSFTHISSSTMNIGTVITDSASFNHVTSSIVRATTLVAYSASFNYLDVDVIDLLGVSSSFTINASADDIDQMLTLQRTTGGAAIFTWNGTQVGLNKIFKPTDLAVSRISQTEPTGAIAGQIWLEVTP